MIDTDFIIAEYEQRIGGFHKPQVFFCPGRVNLLGDHIDYLGGLVLPCALDLGIMAVAEKRDDGKINIYSMNFPEEGVVELENLSKENLTSEYAGRSGWASYPLGMILSMKEKKGLCFTGINILFYGNLPPGGFDRKDYK